MPSDRPVVVLARHGETAWNVDGRMQGQLEVPLAARGETQAKALAARLAASPPARIVSSDLARALATARAVAGETGVPVEVDPRLREQDLGAWQGRTFREVSESEPDLARRFAEREPDARPPGGETRAELSARAWEAFEDLAAPGRRGPLLLVTHGGWIMSVLYRVLRLPIEAPRRFLLPNVGLSTLVWGQGAWFVRTMSDTSHDAQPSAEAFPFS